MAIGFVSLQSAALDSNPDALRNQLIQYFSENQKTKLIYIGKHYIQPGAEGDSSLKFSPERLAELRKIKEKRQQGTLSKVEKEQYASWTEEMLDNEIQNHAIYLEGFQYEYVKEFTTDGQKCRIDVYRPDGKPEYHFYLYDGLNGYVVTPHDHTIRTSPSFTKNWLVPTYIVQWIGFRPVFEERASIHPDRTGFQSSPHVLSR